MYLQNVICKSEKKKAVGKSFLSKCPLKGKDIGADGVNNNGNLEQVLYLGQVLLNRPYSEELAEGSQGKATAV